MQKFFVREDQIEQQNNQIMIMGTDVNHIKHVLRYEPGQNIEVTSIEKAQSYICEIVKLEEEKIDCKIIKKIETSKEANIDIHILQGLPKADKMEWIIQKCTELGVKEITPVDMERCVVKLTPKDAIKKVERWQKIAEAAAKQCGREVIPKINFVHKLKNIYEFLEDYDIVLVAYEKEQTTTLKQVITKLKQSQKQRFKIALLIGPEGGIDEKELTVLKEVTTISLGKRILRTETAGIVLTSILMYELRRFRVVKLGGIFVKEKTTKKIQIEELEKQRKLPDELKEKQNLLVMKNLGFAIFITLYFIFLNMGFHNIVKHIFVVDTQVFSMVVLAVAIILFEKAFKKENGQLAIHGIELLALAIVTLFVPYLYYMNTEFTDVIMIVLIIGFDLYYVSKATVLCAKIQMNYKASLSDVKRIVKKEKRQAEGEEDNQIEEAKTEEKTSITKKVQNKKAEKLQKKVTQKQPNKEKAKENSKQKEPIKQKTEDKAEKNKNTKTNVDKRKIEKKQEESSVKQETEQTKKKGKSRQKENESKANLNSDGNKK